MEPKLIQKTRLGEYTWAEFSGKNESGMYPYGDRVLVMPDQAAKSSSGMIQFTDQQIERNAEAAETGIIVALGPEAFLWNSDRTRKWESADKPKVGDHVVFDRYSGSYQHGRDGKMYRLMDDKCIGALAMDEAREAEVKGEPAAVTAIPVAAQAGKTSEEPPEVAATATEARLMEKAKAPGPMEPTLADFAPNTLRGLVERALAKSPTAAKNIRANPSTIGSFIDVVFDAGKGLFPRDSIEREIREQLSGLSVKE